MIPGIWGAIVGLLGTLLSRGADILDKKSEASAQLELAKSNERVAALELEKAKVAGQVQLQVAHEDAIKAQQIAIEQAQAALMQASMQLTQATDAADKSPLGTFIRAMIRPLLTLVYSAAFLYIVYTASTPEIVKSQAAAIFFAFIDTAVAITLWWFGIRKGTNSKD